MGLKVEPAYIGQTGYQHPVELDRNLLEGLFQRSGGIRNGDFLISQGVGTRAIAIAPGRYFILGVESAQQGGYFAWSDAVETVLLGAAVGNPRIDSILLRAVDDQYGTITGSPRAEIAVVQGVAAGSPTARPDSDFNVGGPFYVPGAWARLGNVRVNTADTASIPPGQITPSNRYVRQPGGRTLVTTSEYPSDPVNGDSIIELDTGLRRYYYGGVWRLEAGSLLENTLGSTAASVTFSGIPGGIKNLRVTWSARSNDAGFLGTDIQARINGDTGGNYAFERIQGQGTGSSALSNPADTRFILGVIPTATALAGVFGGGKMNVFGWNNPHAGSLNVEWAGGFSNSSTNTWHTVGSGRYQPTGPYTSITLLPAAGLFVAGSQFMLEVLS